MKSVLLAAACVLAVASAAVGQDQKVTATFVDQQGKEIGTATLSQTPAGVLISVNVKGLQPGGEHAFHVHGKASCDPKTKFTSAGGHFEGGKKTHGFLTAGGPHAGDMPNQFVGSDGTLRANVLNPYVTFGSGDNSLFGPDGTSIVIHAKVDDYRSQPAGDAGDRIACAVIKK
jgi:Cu-Zn family superoxide dismutase